MFNSSSFSIPYFSTSFNFSLPLLAGFLVMAVSVRGEIVGNFSSIFVKGDSSFDAQVGYDR